MGKIIMNYGKNMQNMAHECLTAINAQKLIGVNRKIIIKPNLVNNTKPSSGATTHPEIIEGIIQYLHDCGFRDIEILESSWVGGDVETAYKVCGYNELSKKYGVPLLNALKQPFKKVELSGIKMNICENVLDGAFLINVPVLKAHCQTKITCCIKNLKGLIPSADKRNFHAIGLHEPIAALGAIVKTGLNVVDGVCGDLTFEEGGTPVETNMVLAGTDALLLDTFAAEFIGYDPETIKYLTLARQHGVGEFYGKNTETIILNGSEKPCRSVKATNAAAALSKYANEDKACSACYSALIRALYRADGKALKRFEKNKIAIGQGFKGLSGDGFGFGDCAKGFSDCVRGCPPKAFDLIKNL